MTDTILQIKGLTRRFGSFTAVDSLDLAVDAGESFAHRGSNGAGKTTTIKMLTTLLRPTSGDAIVAGFSITSQPVDVRRSIGYVPQAVSVDGALTGYENLLIFAKLYGLPRREREDRIRDSLEFTGLTHVAGQLVREYSGGMIRRLEIAQSTLHRPSLIFLDEPTGGLDPIGREAIWEHLARLRQELGTTIFFTTHYMDEAQSQCTRLAIMHLGKIAALGTADELKASLGSGSHTLDDVFVRYAGTALESGGNLQSVKAERMTASRLN
jgi:ABC-2 type transport system ATP-binding protein